MRDAFVRQDWALDNRKFAFAYYSDAYARISVWYKQQRQMLDSSYTQV